MEPSQGGTVFYPGRPPPQNPERNRREPAQALSRNAENLYSLRQCARTDGHAPRSDRHLCRQHCAGAGVLAALVRNQTPSESGRLMTTVAVIGGGPAGLVAAEVISAAGVHVDLYDAMPSVGRKFLLAGIGDLNLTHSEAADRFLARYGERAPQLQPILTEFDAEAVRSWALGLGVETFVGSSGRIVPREMKAAPLLRAWLRRLRASGVDIHARRRWLGWNDDGSLQFATPAGHCSVAADATVLALGGGSWARLGSDGAWIPLLQQRAVSIAPLRPANCGFAVAWSDFFAQRFAGQPLKSIAITLSDDDGGHTRRGECV